MKRREFVAKAGAAAIATAAIVGCDQKVDSGTTNVTKEKVRHWKMVTSWPKNFPGLGTGANFLAEIITKMSGGRIQVKVYGAGELVPALGVFDAVAEGTAQIGHSGAYYWKGKSEATQFFSAVPFGLNSTEMSSWIHHGGGQQLWDELYAGFGLKPFAAGTTGVQMGGWFNRQINQVSDFKGLKMRMPGLGGEVISQHGAAAVTMPGGELFQALQTGAIDATEWVGPYNDLAFGFYKIAKYYYWPGWHEPGTVLEAFVNLKEYESLPKDLQEIVTYACTAAYNQMYSEYTMRNGTSLDTLVKKHKVQLKRFPDSVLKVLGETSRDVVQDLANRDAFSKRVYESFHRFRRNQIDWHKISEEGYAQARALTFK